MNLNELDGLKGFRHLCGGAMQVGISSIDDGEDLATWAICSGCDSAVLIRTGCWDDPRMLLALMKINAGKEAQKK